MKTESKYTPGPWKSDTEIKTNPGLITVSTDYPESLCNGARSIASITGGFYCDKRTKFYKPDMHAENKANARLIAAAPELFQALEGMLAIHGPVATVEESVKAMNQARAAISKAKGL